MKNFANGDNDSKSLTRNKSEKSVPSFFIYPSRLYKFTTIKSPMAHKTFSQEQFLCKNYKLSISFSSSFFDKKTSMGVSNSLYFATFFLKNIPSISTNMFLIQRVTLRFYSSDPLFFSYFFFHKNFKLSYN